MTRRNDAGPMDRRRLCGVPHRCTGKVDPWTALHPKAGTYKTKAQAMLCAEWCLIKRTQPGLTIIPLRCRCWSCEFCAPVRKARLVHEAQAGKPDLFVTLTSVYKPGRCPHMAARALARAWRVVRREYLAEHGKHSLPFLCVFEATKNGWPHIHIVARCKWLDQAWLSKRMEELIGAPIVDVRRVKRSHGVAKYIAKYISKETARFEGVKRYWRSLDYLLPTEDTDETPGLVITDWTIVREDWLTMVQEQEPMWAFCVMQRGQAFLSDERPP